MMIALEPCPDCGSLYHKCCPVSKRPTLDEDDPRCVMCGFQLHNHGKYSQICPVLVRGMLHQFRKAEIR